LGGGKGVRKKNAGGCFRISSSRERGRAYGYRKKSRGGESKLIKLAERIEEGREGV